jgi:hypothetical protein
MLRQNNQPEPTQSNFSRFKESTSAATKHNNNDSSSSSNSPSKPNNHTILLVQITQAKDTRTFLDFDSSGKAVVGAISLYEDRLRQFNPLQTNIKYTVEDLFEFFDSLAELVCLVFDPNLQAYAPKPPEYIKQRCLTYLQTKSQ